MKDESIIRLILGVIGVWLASCGSGGGGTAGGLFISGDVLSPAGQPIGLEVEHGPRFALGPGHSSQLDLVGLLPVPDGTVVDLVRLDDLGDVAESLFSTTTTGGRYAFNLTSLGLPLASDLAVAAGSGVSQMRALAAQAALDVDPVSEALLLTILQQGAGLAPFTVQETSDLEAAARLVVATEGLTAEKDVTSTVALVQQALLVEPALAAFLAAASGKGQTSAGPGDIGDYFPSSLANTWTYLGEHVIEPFDPQAFEDWHRIIAIDGEGVQSVEESNPLDGGRVQEFFEETSTAFVDHGSDDPTDPLAKVGPFDEARFPLRLGASWVQFDVQGLPLGQDLDGDFVDETIAVRSTRTLVAFEDVSVPAGDFTNCARFDTSVETSLTLSTGPGGQSTLDGREWFAPGLGLVRSEVEIFTTLLGESQRETFAEALNAYQVEDAGRGILPTFDLALDLSQGDSEQERPGRPGVGFDGTNYLLVTCRDLDGSPELMGLLVTPRGIVLNEFSIHDLAGISTDCHAAPVVAFDGTNYLVVFRTFGTDVYIVGVRVTPDGSILDPGGFPIAGGSSEQPAVAFDGANYLVVRRQFVDMLGGEIHGSFVTPDGSVIGEFVVHSASGEQGSPAIAFGSEEFLVVWADDTGAADVRGTRVTLGGTVLAPAGFDVSTGTNVDNAPVISFDGTRYLVVWVRDLGVFEGTDILATRLELDGTPSDPAPIQITTGEFSVFPTVAFDGTNHFVAWEIASSTLRGIHAARISPPGVLLDGPPSSLGIPIDEDDGPTFLARPAIVRGTRNTFLAWLVNIEVTAETKDVAGALIYPF